MIAAGMRRPPRQNLPAQANRSTSTEKHCAQCKRSLIEAAYAIPDGNRTHPSLREICGPYHDRLRHQPSWPRWPKPTSPHPSSTPCLRITQESFKQRRPSRQLPTPAGVHDPTTRIHELAILYKNRTALRPGLPAHRSVLTHIPTGTPNSAGTHLTSPPHPDPRDATIQGRVLASRCDRR